MRAKWSASPALSSGCATLALVAGLSVGIAGCVIVTPSDRNDRVACLDEDGDWYVKTTDCADPPQGTLGVDCDDARDYRNPGVDEAGTPALWYDGIDQDCDLADVVDRDADLFSPVTRSAWEALVAEEGSGLIWPVQLLTELDCDDQDGTVFPGSPAEEPYDGIDSDCAADDDFDNDHDGYALRPECLPAGAVYDGPLPDTDCDDVRPDVHPLVAVDPWYDGTDQDCNLANDFDQDGDGYIQDEHVASYNTFIATCGQSDTRIPGDDCNDLPAGEGAVAGDQIHPGAAESWYDGVDQDCAGDDDFDQDGDLYACDGSLVAACAGHAGTDCDDAVAAVHPDAIELIGDAADGDCDGNADGAPFRFHHYLWTGPNAPVVDATDTDFLLGVVSSRFTFPGSSRDNTEAGIALAWLLADTPPPSTPGLRYEFQHAFADNVLSPGLALAGDPDGFFVGMSHVRGDQAFLRLLRVNGSDGSYLSPDDPLVEYGVSDLAPHLDMDLSVDVANDRQWLVGCGEDTVHFVVATGLGDGVTMVDRSQASVPGGRACYLEPIDSDTMHVHVYAAQGGAGHVTYALDLQTGAIGDGSITLVCDSAAAGCDASDGFGLAGVNQRETLTVFAGSDNDASAAMGVTVWDGGVPLGEYLTGFEVRSADGWLHDGDLYLVIVDVDGEVVFAWGDPGGALSQVPLDVAHPGLDVQAEAASIFVDDDRVAIGVSALGGTGDDGDAVGWVFLGR